MAFLPLVPKNGAISYGSFTAEYNAFQITASQNTENVTPYGTNVASVNVGSGTPDFDFTISAFAGAHGTGSAPGLGAAIPAQGSATTFTLDTGVTEAVVMVVSRIQLSHGRMRAAVPYDITGKNFGDVTETWAVS